MSGHRALLPALLCFAASGQVPDFVHASRPHLLTKNPFGSLTPDQSFPLKTRSGPHPLLVLLLDFPDSAHRPANSAAYFDDLVFGAQPSISSYFREVSYGKYTLTRAGVSGWHRAPRPAAYYFEQSQSQDSYIILAAEAVRLAAQAGFSFRDFDRNGDREVTQDELVILLIVADHPPLGLPQFMMTRFTRDNPTGVITPDGVEVDTTAVRVDGGEGSGSA